jgi:DNA-directed RNA polymerase specialized sigma subunit
MSIFRLRDWLKYENHISDTEPNGQYLPAEKIPFELDLNFVFLGADIEPWNILYPYERYIIYLHFTKEFSIMEIARKLKRNKETVSKQLETALLKLKENFMFDQFVA